MNQTTGNKITLGIVLITTVLILFVSAVTIYQTRQDFISFVNKHPILWHIEPEMDIPMKGRLIQESQFEANLYKTASIASIIGVIMAVVFGAVVSRQITKPLKQLKAGIRNLKEGEGKYKILDVEHNDEFSEVINEFNKLVDRLNKSEHLRQALITDVSHELKTPITAINGQLQGIKDGVLDLTDERIDVILEQAERLTDLVNRLQEYTRLQMIADKLRIHNFQFNNIFKRTKKTFEIELEKSNMNLLGEFSEELEIEADEKMIERVLNNLVQNSIKYSGGKTITIKANKDQILVEDDGVGVSQNDLEMIFERFYRVDKSRNRKSGGLGLGLAIVKEIVEAHGWSIVATQGANNKGICFTITLTSKKN